MDGSGNCQRTAGSTPHRRRHLSRRIPLTFLVLAGVSLLCLDFSMGSWFVGREIPDELENLLSAAEHFGTPYGQIMILVTIFIVGHRRSLDPLRIYCGAAAAGIAANCVKLVVARTRPRAFDFDSQSLWDGFTHLFPMGFGGSAVQSFPSAHAASAFAFAAMMTWAYPRGRAIFLTLAMLTGMERICNAAHFPSDVFLGAALGWSAGILFVEWTPLAAWFSRLESRWAASGDRLAPTPPRLAAPVAKRRPIPRPVVVGTGSNAMQPSSKAA